MATSDRKTKQDDQDANGASNSRADPTAGRNSADEGETISGYFRKVFAENPKWLDTRSNDAVLQRWRDDHPGYTVVPDSVKNGLSNIKGILRKNRRKKGGRPKKEEQAAVEPLAAPIDTENRDLEVLEEQIDDCLSLAKRIDKDGLARAIILLRKARNGVVWKLGE